MKLPKRVIYTLFGFIILLNIIIRYPFIPHEAGSDSFLMNSYANSISGYGYATWIIHPYSFLGLTPDSYPSAVLFLLSGCSQAMNLNMELSILIFSILIGLLGLFGAILLAKQIRNDDLFIILVVFLYSTAPIFLRFTFWTASTRNLFLGLFPFFLWSLLKIREYSDIQWKFISINIILFIILLSVHRMGLLILLVILAYVITFLIFRYKHLFEFNNVIPKIAVVAWIFIFFSFIFMQIMNFGIYKDMNITHTYQTGQFFKGNNPLIILMNMIIDYNSRIGLLTIFGVIGFGTIMIKRGKLKSNIKSSKNFNETLIIIILLSGSSMVLLGVYLTLFLLPFFILLISFGIMWCIKFLKKIKWKIIFKNRNTISMAFIVVLLISSLIFSITMLNHSNKPVSNSGEQKWIEDETIDTTFYFNKYNNDHNYVSNSELMDRRIDAWLDEPINYELDLEAISLEKGGLTELVTEETLYVKKGEEGDQDLNIPGGDVNDKSSINYLDRNNIKFVIEINSVSGKTVGLKRLYDSRFLETMHEERYKIYGNDLESIWFV